ncbi:hypothetical protein LCGC14_0364990 [marine sediment metagenome]|uniref:Uncharacterized protein n=1 Tax=marine sediment metagenome TaxID=412755 RepID=A0A0F9TPX2_9ZZZZ
MIEIFKKIPLVVAYVIAGTVLGVIIIWFGFLIISTFMMAKP